MRRMVTGFNAWLLKFLGKQTPATEPGTDILVRLSEVRALILI